mmetsp:Transcript_24989/g.39253  ORF Transcript_24989/g.39253 Transcript_24989/m.39253 type:complete len:177 (+) Transcript_24989:112-642(+)
MCCHKAGQYGEASMPQLCMVIEAVCFYSCAISSTRNLVMDTRDIMPDPCDARLIRINNCLQILSCLCSILAVIDDTFVEAAILLDFIADVFFAIISSCMQAQVDLELKASRGEPNWGRMGYLPPSTSKRMNQEGGGGGGGGIPMQMAMHGNRCSSCGTQSGPQDRFCNSCGKNLSR